MILVVMAAGMGNRFGGLKQVTPFGPNGEFLLDYSVYDAIKAGFDKVVFIIKEENLELFKEVVGKHLEKHIKVEYVFQKQDDIPEGVVIPETRIKPWGTAHALYSARNVVDSDFVILNADDFYGRDTFEKIAEYFKSTNDKPKACMVGYKLKNTLTDEGTVSRGICNVENDVLVKIDERLKIKREDGVIKYFEDDNSYPIDEEAIASMNVFGFSKEIFNYVEDELNLFFEKNKDNLEKVEFLLPYFVGELVKKNLIQMRVFSSEDTWMGVTYKEDSDKVKEGINKLVESGKYPSKLWK
jgi:NDP-sugar pyrophosphorylase family protein